MEIKVCVGSACYVKGSHQVIEEIGKFIAYYRLQDQLQLKAAFCLGNCTQAVSVEFDGKVYGVNKEEVKNFFEEVVCRRLSQ